MPRRIPGGEVVCIRLVNRWKLGFPSAKAIISPSRMVPGFFTCRCKEASSGYWAEISRRFLLCKRVPPLRKARARRPSHLSSKR